MNVLALDTRLLFGLRFEVRRRLCAGGIRSVSRLVECSRAELLAIPGLGRQALAEIENYLAKCGLALKESVLAA